MPVPVIWLNGECVEGAVARLSPQDRGLLLGDGLFETLLAVDGKPMFAPQHFARLRAGAAVLDIPAAPSEPTLLMTASPAPNAPISVSLHTAAIRRNPSSPLSRLKSLNYLDNILARRAALAAGADEALMLNTDGRVACAAAANIWILKDGAAVTPPEIEGVLKGIVRGRLLDELPRRGIEAAQRPVTVDDLARADEVFITNSLLGVCPVASLDGKKRKIELASELRDAFDNTF